VSFSRLFAQFPVLESDTIVLRKVTEDDLKDLFEIYSNDDVFIFCGIIPKKNVEVIRKMVSHFERDYRKQKRIKWGICRKTDVTKLLEIVEAFNFKRKANTVTVGYFLNERFWNKGITTEAVRILVNYLLNEVGVERIRAEVMLQNNYSKRVLEKNGFTKEGTTREKWSGKGIVNLEVFSVLKKEE
jgi:ribosomal-protein-alanine N-acetyltransferase